VVLVSFFCEATDLVAFTLCDDAAKGQRRLHSRCWLGVPLVLYGSDLSLLLDIFMLCRMCVPSDYVILCAGMDRGVKLDSYLQKLIEI
jgi:hypothetical protein